MSVKTVGIDEEIVVGDEIRFVLDTHDGSNCISDPYQIVDARIYFISREFTDSTASEYDAEFVNPELQSEYDRIKKAVCIKSKQMVRAASTSNVTLSGLQIIDGISLAEGDRVLLKDQFTNSENGIYVVSDNVWQRASDADSEKTVVPGMYVFVESGIQNAATGWVLEAESPVAVGSVGIKFLLFATDWEPASPDSDASENSRRLEELKIQINSSKTKSPFFYKDALTVKRFGGDVDSSGEFFPAWLNPDYVSTELKGKVMSDNILQRLEDENGVVQGKFVLNWATDGIREGDYFICWSWRPTMGDETISAHQFFYVSGNLNATSSIPTHRVRADKYELLMERYTPLMFKARISDSDLSPEVISEFNKAVAKGFMFVENQAGSVIDLLDSNSIHEQLIPLLSNMFNLKVKSGDPTLWRRQVKKAIPNFKKKGSIAGLREAMGDAGMKLVRFARLWQVVPKYTHQEHFIYKGSNQFNLTKVPSSQNECDFEIWFRDRQKGSEWTVLSSGCGSSSSSSGGFISVSNSTMTWNMGRLALKDGDSIRVMYPFRSIPAGERAKENYLRSLPLMDDRDERDENGEDYYPPKNWNVHLIEEDDENFGVLVPVRHPLADPIVWGRVRTEFPYSENLYNMEEYNGSKRDSFNPCDIDKSFMDPCGQCASSKFNMDIEVDMISDDSFAEAMRITEEYMPFHAVPNSLNFWGSLNEFIRHSEERISAMIQYSREDTVLAGEGQHIFSRDVYQSDIDSVKRNLLAGMTVINNPSGGSNWTGVAKYDRTLLLSRITIDENEVFDGNLAGLSAGFTSLNVDTSAGNSDPFENGNLLEVLGSSPRYYSILSLDASGAVVKGTVDSALVGPVLEYRISNRVGDFNVDIQQHEEIIFNDYDHDFTIVGIISQHDIDMGHATGTPWRFLRGNKEYSVENVLPDGSLLLKQTNAISTISGWRLVQGSVTKKEGSGGSISVTGYGLVEIKSPSNIDVRETFKLGDCVYFDWGSSPRAYKISSFQKNSNKFYIRDRVDGSGTYDEGGMAGEDTKIYRRVMEKKIGQFGYDGLMIVSNQTLNVSNAAGHDPNNVNSSLIRENHILFMDGDYYTISGVSGNNLTISGPEKAFDTIGSPVQFNIYRFSKELLSLSEKQVPPYDTKPNVHEFNSADENRDEFSKMDRSGGFIISKSAGEPSAAALSSLLNSTEALDVMSHDERIEYEIEYREEK